LLSGTLIVRGGALINFTVKIVFLFCLCCFVLLSYLAARLNLRINLKDLSRAAHCGCVPPTISDLLEIHESRSKHDLLIDACIQSAPALLLSLHAWLCLLAKIPVGKEGEHCSDQLLREKTLRAARRRRELGSHDVCSGHVACFRDTEKIGRRLNQFYIVSRAAADKRSDMKNLLLTSSGLG
jgi:hypothetical protein